MKYLIIGGSKSGKSDIGEKLCLSLNKDKIIYIATMKPYDDEDKQRIRLHIKKRENYNFETIEKETDLNDIVYNIKEEDTVILDSVTSLLTNEMFKENKIIYNVSDKIVQDIKAILNIAKNVVIISDYIFSDCMNYDKITEHYKKQLGLINVALAKECDNVIECSFGEIKYRKISNRGIYEKIL